MQFASENFESWSVDEYARRMLARKHPVHRHSGIWWLQVRRRFCWPLDPFVTLPPSGCSPAWHCAVAGHHFLVEKPADGNSWFNPMLLDAVATYGLERMDSKRRNLVRKGLKSCVVRPLMQPDEMTRDGWTVESEFFERTQWHTPPARDQWPAHIARAFENPVIDHKLGAFVNDRMVGYLCWCGIGRTAHLTHIATSHEGLKACANDALLFEWVDMLRASGQYDRAAYAVRSFKASLDAFKDEHLFRLRSLPARLVLNPLLRIGLKRLKPEFLARLEGLDDAAARDWLVSGRAAGKPAKPAANEQAPASES